MKKPPIWIAMIPSFFAMATLGYSAAAAKPLYDYESPMLLWVIVGCVAGLVFARGHAKVARRDWTDQLLLAVCFMTPLSMVYAWIWTHDLSAFFFVVPKIDVHLYGFEKVWHWMFDQPSEGWAININAALLILGMQITAFAPVVFGLYCILAREPRIWLLLLWTTAAVALYGVIVWKVDHWMFTDAGRAAPWAAAFGPSIRALGFAAMAAHTLRLSWRRALGWWPGRADKDEGAVDGRLKTSTAK